MNHRIEMFDLISQPELISRFWKAYTEAFKKQEKVCGQNQVCFSRSAFESAMKDEDWVKFILFSEENPIGIGVTTCNLEKARISTFNPESHVLAVQKIKAKDDVKLFAIPIIAIKREFQDIGLFRLIIKTMFSEIEKLGGDAVVMDYSTKKNMGLPEATIAMAEQGVWHVVDRQEYGFFVW